MKKGIKKGGYAGSDPLSGMTRLEVTMRFVLTVPSRLTIFNDMYIAGHSGPDKKIRSGS